MRYTTLLGLTLDIEADPKLERFYDQILGCQTGEEAEAMARAESNRISAAIAGAQTQLATARAQVRDGRTDDAIATVDAALASLPVNPLTQKLVADLKKEKASALLDRAQALLKRGDMDGARAALAAQTELAPSDARAATVAQRIARAEAKTAAAPGVDPRFIAERAATAELIAKGRAQYVAGDIDGGAYQPGDRGPCAERHERRRHLRASVHPRRRRRPEHPRRDLDPARHRRPASQTYRQSRDRPAAR